jgi:hypothetical protein
MVHTNDTILTRNELKRKRYTQECPGRYRHALLASRLLLFQSARRVFRKIAMMLGHDRGFSFSCLPDDWPALPFSPLRDWRVMALGHSAYGLH